MKFSLSSPIIALLVATFSNELLSHHVFAQFVEQCESFVPYKYNSGPTSEASTIISYPSAPWIQLDLSETELDPTAKLILTGTKASQELDAATLALNVYSAVFDGDSVKIELVTSSGGSSLFRGGKVEVKSKGVAKSHVEVSSIKVGLCEKNIIAESICGTVDDRVPSNDPRQGRIGGCTGWLISEDVFIQAGHCGTPSSSTSIHFTYGVSSAPVKDQYAVDVSTYQGTNGGTGNDWGVGRLLPNISTGKLPGVAQSEKCGTPGCGWYTLGDVPSTTAGNNIRITGYGTAAVDSRSQKTHMGGLTTIGNTYLQYVPDTTGGNSGSPVIHEETGHAIGVHTHGGCSASGGSNQGTRIDRSDFAAHINLLLANSPPPPPTTSNPTTSPPTTPPPTTSPPTTPPPTTSPITSPPTTSPPTTSSPTGALVTASFIASYGAPACSSIGTTCSSGQLLVGTATTIEPNPPNTLDNCEDGPYGLSHHSDESIDKITVSAVGGGVLRAGGLAEIQATVWPYGSGSYDTADFYYATNGTNPTWQLVGSRAAGGSGLRTLSVQYQLPHDASIQAVRVQFRYFGSQVPCSGGNWDDVDDLVFSVDQSEGATTMKPDPVPPLTPIESSICASIDTMDRCDGSSSVCQWKTGSGKSGKGQGKSGKGQGRSEGCYPMSN